ncbi:hypothetical protein GCM10009795_096540 [Nocardioides hankookensis]|uniref:Uncharacterized protein n=1 Tax=Nocardioides hankookensis TaxID=443157 RepID=A0ABW1LLQ0_9ACTN
MITIKEQLEAVARADTAIAHLAAHPSTSHSRLGAAHDQLNLVRNLSTRIEVFDAVMAIETSVLEVYGHIPTHD